MAWLVGLFVALGVGLSVLSASLSEPITRGILLAGLAGAWAVLVLPYGRRPRDEALRVFAGALLLGALFALGYWLWISTAGYIVHVLLGVGAGLAFALVGQYVLPRRVAK